MIEGALLGQPLMRERVSARDEARDPPQRDFREAVDAADRAAPAAADPKTEQVHADEGTVAEHLDARGQSLLLPWQLVANSALSHLFPAAGAGASTAAASVSVAVHAGSVGVQSQAATGVAHVIHAAAPATTAMTALPVAEPRTTTATRTAASAATDAGALLSGLAERWQQRLLRWSQQDGQALNVRIRDFRLDAAGEQALAAQLVSFAQREGLPLQTITINARALWHAGHYLTAQQGDTHGR